MNAPALKAALLAYSGPMAIDPDKAVYVHDYGHCKGYITYAQAAEWALARIEALERESMDRYRSSDRCK